jgi:rhomboid protease GluP
MNVPLNSGEPVPPVAKPEAEVIVKETWTPQRHAPLTLLACAVCVGVFLGLSSERNSYSWEALEKWGFYSAARIRQGAIWGFLTSTFVHLELWHVGFNVYWLYVLGSRLEKVIGSGRWLAFFLTSAFINSGAEFAVADTTGYGASGVVYALFGFMWVTKVRYPTFEKVLDGRTIFWFVAWLLGCVAATLTKVWEVGNSAHIAGLLFGAGVGAWSMWPARKKLLQVGFAFLVLLSIVPVVWAPWSSDWTSTQAMSAYRRGNYPAAVKWYQRSLKLGADKVWCWESIAVAYHAAGDEKHYKETLNFLSSLDEKAAKETEDRVLSAQAPTTNAPSRKGDRR